MPRKGVAEDPALATGRRHAEALKAREHEREGVSLRATKEGRLPSSDGSRRGDS
jgi:hypothetical protein